MMTTRTPEGPRSGRTFLTALAVPMAFALFAVTANAGIIFDGNFNNTPSLGDPAGTAGWFASAPFCMK